jgi:hypothetical protein
MLMITEKYGAGISFAFIQVTILFITKKEVGHVGTTREEKRVRH